MPNTYCCLFSPNRPAIRWNYSVWTEEIVFCWFLTYAKNVVVFFGFAQVIRMLNLMGFGEFFILIPYFVSKNRWKMYILEFWHTNCSTKELLAITHKKLHRPIMNGHEIATNERMIRFVIIIESRPNNFHWIPEWSTVWRLSSKLVNQSSWPLWLLVFNDTIYSDRLLNCFRL